MAKSKVTVSAALTTAVVVEKVERIAAECGVKLTLVETRLRKDRRWVNDFEVEGAPGKVDRFLGRIQDVEVDDQYKKV